MKLGFDVGKVRELGFQFVLYRKEETDDGETEAELVPMKPNTCLHAKEIKLRKEDVLVNQYLMVVEGQLSDDIWHPKRESYYPCLEIGEFK